MFIPLRDHNPTRRTPLVNYSLIAANVLVWLLQVRLAALESLWVVAEYGLIPARLSADPLGQAGTLLTSTFMHSDWLHLGFNMLFLHVFGDNVEDVLGRGRYLFFYLVCGVLASLGHYLVDPQSPIPMVGASGAIYGVLGAYVVLYPRAPVEVLNPYFLLWFVIGPIPALPAWAVVGAYFVQDLLRGFWTVGEQVGGGTAYFAHISGFLVGLLWARLSLKPPDARWSTRLR